MNLKSPSIIYIILISSLFLISVILGTPYLIEGLSGNHSSPTKNINYDPDNLDTQYHKDYSSPNYEGGFGVPDGEINLVSGTMNPTDNDNKDKDNFQSFGIPGSQIPKGSEDLYILKSQVVPPVCPACPSVSSCPRKEPCPPCPACARCPEPAFDCKKVPNYSSNDDRYLPRPVLADFSQFGM